MYVEELIGPETVNTLPPKTLAAFRDHGRVRQTLQEGVEQADADIAQLPNWESTSMRLRASFRKMAWPLLRRLTTNCWLR